CSSAGAALSPFTFVLTNAFSGAITLTNGDISEFFEFNSNIPKAGVCVSNDTGGLASNPITDQNGIPLPGTDRLGPNTAANEPNNTALQRIRTSPIAIKHPSGFNQRRLISAFNPNLNGGTIFVGLDLPGGFPSGFPNSVANPNYTDPT